MSKIILTDDPVCNYRQAWAFGLLNAAKALDRDTDQDDMAPDERDYKVVVFVAIYFALIPHCYDGLEDSAVHPVRISK